MLLLLMTLNHSPGISRKKKWIMWVEHAETKNNSQMKNHQLTYMIEMTLCERVVVYEMIY